MIPEIIKVCGMRNPENVRQLGLIKGVKWMGLIFHPESSRFAQTAPEKITQSPHLKRIGVFVNRGFEEIMRTAARYNLYAVQLHGDEDVALCARLKDRIKVIKVFRVGPEFKFEDTELFEEVADYFLFDTAGESYGGNGTKFRWEMLSNYKGERPFLIAGGISPEDAQAVLGFEHTKCVGIDLNSGFEDEPALKNTSAIKKFVNELSCLTA